MAAPHDFRRRRLALLATATLIFPTLSMAEKTKLPPDAPRFDPPPRLAITAKELAERKASPDFAKVKEEAVRAGDALVENPVPLADGSGSWIFYYANPDNGQPLTPISLTEHKDPTTGKIFTDERTVASYRTVLHNAMDRAALTLGWAYAYTEDPRYAEGVRRILLKLAHDYASYPDRLDRWGRTGDAATIGGRRYVQSLDEAYGVIQLAKAYDLTRTSSVYSEEDRHEIEEKFFRPTAVSLLRGNYDINNHQTWYNAGLMNIASVLADRDIVDKVLTMKGGYYDQLQRSLGEDGLWYEGTMAYHRYALQAMIEIVDAGRRMGLPLQDEPKFKKLFTAPLHAAYPNGTFPSINDSDALNISMMDSAWQWAWEVYHDPYFAQALARGDQAALEKLLGPGTKPAWPIPLTSEALKDSGIAILRMGTGAEAVSVFLDYGPHGGSGHGHYDKLNLMLFANGREWLLDPGRLTYSHKEYKTWVKTTAAHNTVSIGGRNQSEALGELLYLQQEKDFAAAAIECDTAYPDTHLRRYVLLTPRFLVDVFDVKTSPQTQIDLFAHAISDRVQPATPSLPEPKAQSAGETEGYQHITDTMMRQVSENSQWDFIAGDLKLRASLIGSPGEEIFTGESIGYTITQKIPTLIRRRHAEQTRFVTVYDLSGQGSEVKSISEKAGVAPSVTIETSQGTFVVTFDDTKATLSPQ